MIFSDKDLERFKEQIGEDPYASKYVDCLEYEKVMALLARLKAAEHVASFQHCNHMPIPECNACIAQEAWRKASGKKGGTE